MALAATSDLRLVGVGVREPDPTTDTASRLDVPGTGGVLVDLIPSVVRGSPVSQAESLSPPLETESIPSLAVSSLVSGDISLGRIFLMSL